MNQDASTGNLSTITPRSRHVRDFIVDFLAGSAGGTACVYCGQPLDTIKVKMQAFPGFYRGGLDCFKQILKSEGLNGLYKGSVPALVCNVAENSVLFVALGFSKKFVASVSNTDYKKLSTLQMASAGSIASIFSAMVVCPNELIKCRMQALTEMAASGKIVNKSMGPWGIVRQIMRERGPSGFMTGITSTWARELPGYFAFFYGYELTRDLLTPPGKTKNDIGPLGLMFAGGTAGVFLWILVYPIDAVKSQIQVLSQTGKQYGFLKTFRGVVRTKGFFSLYSGLLPCIIRSYPANGALFLAYETTQKLLENF
uniref:mitochondrial ornithine transporter 1-like n=1 Tax=Styela clava TaxID=7725 RepID=UPI00193A538B|nr:mitochondrial ornithine transporter 1-like [Styela clava]